MTKGAAGASGRVERSGDQRNKETYRAGRTSVAFLRDFTARLVVLLKVQQFPEQYI